MWRLGRLLTIFRKELRLAWAVLRDRRSPKAAKLVTVLAALYVISPVDFIPDTIPILGWLDDGMIGFLLLQLAFQFLPAELLASLRAGVPVQLTLSGPERAVTLGASGGGLWSRISSLFGRPSLMELRKQL